MKDGDIQMLEYVADYFLSGDVPLLNNEVESVLTEVPSYEKWQEKLEENKRLKHDVGNLGYKIKNQRHEIDNRLKEIEKLKELLKECINYVDKYVAFSVVQGNEERKVKSKELLTKINQVLGEE
jgi:ribosomal protein S20